MNGDGYDDVIAFSSNVGLNRLEWYVHYAIPGATPFPTNDSTLDVDAAFSFGLPADIPRVGDLNGDGKADILAVRNDSSLFDWYIHNVSGSYPNDVNTILGVSTTINDYGANTTVPVIGDWDNDGDDNIGVVVPGTPGTWHLDTNGGGAAEIVKQFGLAGDQYIVGKWADVLWNGNTDSNWSTASNWSGGNVPVAGQDVVIDQPTTAVAITSNGTANAATVTSRENIFVTGGTFDISGNIEAAAFSINGGNLIINGTLTSPVLSLNTGIFTWTAAGQVTDPDISVGANALRNIGGGYTKGVRYNVATSLTVDFNADIILSGEISGPGQLIKNGPGRLQLTNNNPYTGLTTINAGEIYLTNSGLLGSSAAGTVINGGAALRLAAGKTNADALTMQGVSPMLVADTGGTATQSGTITLNATDAANFTTNDNGNLVVSGSIGGSSGFTKVGSGTLTLSGANTYDGVTTLQLGTLTVSGAGTLGSTVGGTRVTGNDAFDQVILNLASGVVSNEDFTFNGDNPIIRSNGATLAGDVVLAAVGKIGLHPSGAGPLTISGDVSGSISGTSELDIATDVVFSGNNTYSAVNRIIASGSLTTGSNTGISPNSTAEVLQGTLDLNGFDASVGDLEAPSNATGTVNIGTGTLTIGSSNESLAFLGSITGTGNLIKTGTGTQTLSGTSTFTGVTTVIGGELEIDGMLPGSVIVASGASLSGSGTVGAATVQSGGTARPGNSPGILNTGDFNLAAGATLEIEIGGLGANAGIDYDQVNVTGTVTLAGFLDSAIYSNFNAFEDYVIINNDGVNPVIGTFSGMPEGLSIQVNGVPFYITYVGGDGNDAVLQSDYGLKTVLNTNDSGIGSLRQAILGANAAFGTDAIFFNISGSGPHTIQPLSSFPLITDKVVVDGHELSDLNGSPNIELRGDLAGPGVNGLHLALGSSGSTISGLIINRFSQDGIWVDSSSNTVVGNWIGTDISGTNPAGNSANGIALLAGADSNTIYGNVIAANQGHGILVQSDQNHIYLTWIGIDPFGGAMGNIQAGVFIFGGSENVIGRSGNEDFDQVVRNVISDNSVGVLLQGTSLNNRIAGNYIGLNALGNAALGVQQFGIRLSDDDVDGTIIGTNGDGLNDQYEGNVISGNTDVGVVILGADNSVIAGNWFGLNATGTAAIPGGQAGISLGAGTEGTRIGSDANGTSDNFERNLIVGSVGNLSGNNYGIALSGAGTINNVISGNYIGLASDGDTVIANAVGVQLTNIFVGENTIGGTSIASRNVISGNTGAGVNLNAAPGTLIVGNYIGTDATGTQARGNLRGVLSQNAAFGTVGGPLAGQRNLISGNSIAQLQSNNGGTGGLIQGNYIGLNAAGDALIAGGNAGYTSLSNSRPGVQILDNTVAGYAINIDINSSDHVIQGNRIGTDATGLIALGGVVGINIASGAANTLIGGFTATPGTGAGNVIAGTTSRGIQLTSSSGNDTRIRGNIIGLAADGVTDVTIGGEGIRVTGGLNAIIGGDDAADGTVDGVIEARNIISGFGATNQAGIGFSTSGSTLNTIIQGNYIGTDITGTLARGNYVGVAVGNAPGTVIGGISAGAGNVISANAQQGISVFVNGASTIQGNIIGLNATGTAALGNSQGIDLSTSNNLVGGTDPAARNVISGNGEGLRISGATSTANTVRGNLIGTDISGLLDLGHETGIQIVSAVGTIIGGAIANAGNVISGNEIGVLVESLTAAPTSTLIAGNYIGVDMTGAGALGNEFDGIDIRTGGNTIGGTDPLARNIISGNSQRGIIIHGVNAVANTVAGNYIGTDVTGNAAHPNFVGVRVTSASNTIGGSITGAGNLISGNAENGVYVSGVGGNTIQGNTIGLNVTGDADLGNAGSGIMLDNTANNVIGGNSALTRNTISGNDFVGVYAFGITTTGNIIRGNYIGTDVTGTAAIGNGASGIAFTGDASSNIVGGDSTAGEGNLISGNANAGIAIGFSGGKSTDNVVQGNIIGLDATGLVAMPNFDGLTIAEGASSGNQIGGTGTGQGNIISGNLGRGVVISGTGADNNVLAGNFIGTNISGTAAIGNASIGVAIEAGASNNTIGGLTTAHRNIISGNLASGVHIAGASATGNSIQGNLIGTNAAGTAAIGNAIGVTITSSASNNTIGGTTSGAENVISGNSGVGVLVTGVGTTGNVVAGNTIGLASNGIATISNLRGIQISGAASNNLVGTNGDGIGDAQERNVISGNNDLGIWITGNGTNSNIVAGNLIGTDRTGTLDRGNAWDGIRVEGSAKNTRIGTDADGVHDAAERNVISGNNQNGIWVRGAGTDGTVIAGNYLGTNAAGSAVIGNSLRGVHIGEGVKNTRIGTNSDGIADAAEGNLISGNLTGIWLADAGTTGNLVAGNLIGTDVTGLFDLGNAADGVLISLGATTNTIGGSDLAARNIISGNNSRGVAITGSMTSGNIVQGNYIGVNAAGTASLGNGSDGIRVASAGNMIGGSEAGAGNLVSGNGWNGINIDTAAAVGNKIQGNYVGLNAAGTDRIANANHGVLIWGGAIGTIVGTDGDGVNDATEGNVISGNTWDEVSFWTGGADQTVIAGNLLGTTADGLTALTRNRYGVWVTQGALNTRIGTNADGISDELERNIISGGGSDGVRIDVAGVANARVAGNFIGTDINETVDLGNAGVGVRINNSSGNTIGGSAIASRNVISGNSGDGVRITGNSASGNRVQGNHIGTNVTGCLNLGNSAFGVAVVAGATSNFIGTDGNGVGDEFEDNVISGNGSYGIWIGDEGTNDNTIAGNFIGLDATGTSAVANANSGVLIGGGATNNIVGGSNANDRNVISGNILAGVAFQGSGTTGNVAAGNFIGTDVKGRLPLGNQGYGIVVEDNSSDNQIGLNVLSGGNLISANVAGGIQHSSTLSNEILNNHIGTDITGVADLGNSGPGISVINGWAVVGGLAANRFNRIAFNTTGIVVTGGGRASIRGNAIFDNDGLGIDLGNDGVTANDSGDADTGPSGLQNYPILTPAVSGGQTRVIGQFESTPASSFDIDFFASTVADSSGFGESQRFLGSISVTTNVSGFVALVTWFLAPLSMENSFLRLLRTVMVTVASFPMQSWRPALCHQRSGKKT